MIFAVLITIPSNGQTLSTSVFIIPDSVIIFRLWLAHWVQVLCLATWVSCSSLASSWPIRPRVWNLNRSVIPDLLAWASTMLWRGTKSKFYPLDIYIYIYDLLTYCRVASQFTVCDASAAFSILAESSLHCFLSFASSVILTRSSVEWSLKWSISPRSLFSTIGRVVVGRPLSLWPYWMK